VVGGVAAQHLEHYLIFFLLLSYFVVGKKLFLFKTSHYSTQGHIPRSPNMVMASGIFLLNI